MVNLNQSLREISKCVALNSAYQIVPVVQESTLNIEGAVVAKIGSRFSVPVQAKVIHRL